MNISVIIPVYNAEKYLAEAIDSALMQEQVKEVILVEDGSPDDALSVCEEYVLKDSRVKLFRHPGGANLGAGASRNLALDKCTMPFIAFLDADDLCLKNRFEDAERILEEHPDALGVHESIGAIFESPEHELKFKQRSKSMLTGISVEVKPDQLFRVLTSQKYDHISLVGLTLRKNKIPSDLRFDTELLLSQDIDFIYRASLAGALYQGTVGKAIAVRRVHDSNRIYDVEKVSRYRKMLFEKMVSSKFYGSKDRIANTYLLMTYIGMNPLYRKYMGSPSFVRYFIALILLIKFAFSNPRVIKMAWFPK